MILGAIEGVLEEYLKYMDENKENESTIEEEQANPLESSTFWSKQRIVRFIYKFARMIVILIILSIPFIALLKTILDFMNGGLGDINWNYVVLMPSFKIYKAFTKVMTDVVNNTDEAANDAPKVYSGYNTAFGLYESLKTLHSATTETEKETKNSTNNTDGRPQ